MCKVVVKDAQGLRVERPGCSSAEGAQADGAGEVGGAVEKVCGGYGVTAGVGSVALVEGKTCSMPQILVVRWRGRAQQKLPRVDAVG